MRRRRGSALIETAMFMPLLILLLVGMTELGRVTYVYYTLHKQLYTLARYLGTQQGANLCDEGDPVVASAKNFALTGTSDGSSNAILDGMSAALVQIRVERYSSENSELGLCECSISGCDAGAGGRPPDFIVVSIPDGYPVRVNLPYLSPEIILFRPRVRVPFGGT